MVRYIRREQRIIRTLLLTNLITLVLLVLTILLAIALPLQKKDTGLTIDGQLAMELADDYEVSVGYLQELFPDYLVYQDGAEYIFLPQDGSLPHNELDASLLSWVGDRAVYSQDGKTALTGVDVSVYQGKIDWEAVAADGIDFAMIRLAYRGYGSGSLMVDEYAEINLAGATAAGLDIGAYIFSQATTVEEALEEADLVINMLKDYDVTYPVVFDMEEIHEEEARVDNLTIAQRTEITDAFCKAIKKEGYTPMIYGNTRWLAGRLDLRQLKDYDIWYAQYYHTFQFPYAFTMWQYTDSGTVAGIEGEVDLNLCFKTYK